MSSGKEDDGTCIYKWNAMREYINILSKNFQKKTHFFGSRSEGSTTPGLHSDLDSVMIPDKMVVITDNLDEIPEEMIYTFKMDKYTNKGYCLLRDISFDNYSFDCYLYGLSLFRKHHQRNSRYLKNTFRFLSDWHGKKPKIEGPAIYFRTAFDEDIIFLHAFYCSSWPREASNTFLYNQTARYWPSDQLVQDILQSRCFVVPKGSSDGQYSDIEWRLSFSYAERLLMFDLNCVHIRCYVLLKYVQATFLDNIPNCKGIVSSYICKTVLFHTQTPKTD
ncbi:hypothetical protein ACF0H5_021708 [Mactra antiquata]